jgi:acetyl-CoA C-acetyltransferase
VSEQFDVASITITQSNVRPSLRKSHQLTPPNHKDHLMEDIVIVSAARTAVGTFRRRARPRHRPRSWALSVIREAVLARAGLSDAQVGEVIMGQVLAAGSRAEPGAAGLHEGGPCLRKCPALTINAVCGSGLKAVMLAAQAVAWGDSEVVIAGGQENMSAGAPRAAMGRATASAWATGRWSTP